MESGEWRVESGEAPLALEMRDGVARSLFAGIAWPLIPWWEWGLGCVGITALQAVFFVR